MNKPWVRFFQHNNTPWPTAGMQLPFMMDSRYRMIAWYFWMIVNSVEIYSQLIPGIQSHFFSNKFTCFLWWPYILWSLEEIDNYNSSQMLEIYLVPMVARKLLWSWHSCLAWSWRILHLNHWFCWTFTNWWWHQLWRHLGYPVVRFGRQESPSRKIGINQMLLRGFHNTRMQSSIVVHAT